MVHQSLGLVEGTSRQHNRKKGWKAKVRVGTGNVGCMRGKGWEMADIYICAGDQVEEKEGQEQWTERCSTVMETGREMEEG